MRNRFIRALVSSLVLAVLTNAATAPRAFAAGAVVISQVYGGGGNAGATLKNDYIELHNRSSSSVSVAGWSVQYASAAGTSWASTALSGTIPAGGYYLVQEAAGAGGVAGPTPDASGAIAMAAGAGKVALLNVSTTLGAISCPTGPTVVDFVGYGSTANCSEGSPTVTLSNTTAALRGNSGCLDTDANSTDFTSGVPSPHNSASAVFSCAPPQRTLDVLTVGSGSVAKAPDQASYDDGTLVNLTATPAPGWHFVGWSGDATGSANPLSVTMNANKTITATFAINTYTLDVLTIGSGSVAKVPDQALYDHGSNVDLTATPAANWHFVGWSGDASGAANPLAVTMTGNKTITAMFAIDTHPLDVLVVGSGSVAKSPDLAAYDHGALVDLTATPAPGWHFVGWSGDATGSTNPLSVTMDAAKTITATFAINTYTLDVLTIGGGSVAKVPDQALYDHGSNVDLTATPAANWHFVGWSGDASGSANPLGVTMDGNKTITATFAIDTHTLDVLVVGSGSVAKSPDLAAYDHGALVDLTATPAPGWHFVGWSGDATGSANPLGVTMDAAKTVTATFAINTYTLAVTTVGSGSVAKVPDQASYDHGTLVDLTTTADPGWHFVAWSGDASGSANPLTVTMDGNKAITATFAINTYTLDVLTVGSGSVAKVPDQASYDHGALVDLTATPALGWHFVGWSGDATGAANPLSVTMDGNKTITATFAINTYTLAVTTIGSGSVAKAPDQALYDHGTLVNLTATADPGWHFVGWSGDATGSANPLSVTMDGNKAITATFAINIYTLDVLTVGSGSVAKVPDQASYDHGAVVSLTATADPGWHFVGWSGDASGSTNPLSVTMDGNKAITATFALNTYTLAVTTVGSGSVAKAPDQPLYDHGTLVSLTATAAPGWQFAGWSGDASGSANPLSVTMDANKAITATFEQIPVLVVSQVYGGGGNTGATLKNDFIELYNRGPATVNLSGWTVQYTSASGTTWLTTPLTGSIVPGGYHLVQEAAGLGVAAALPTPDDIGSIAMSATAGKVAIVHGTLALSGACPSGPEILDLVGYGAANCSEGSPTAALSNATADFRIGGGCTDTGNNLADFVILPPVPRNSASPLNTCSGTLVVTIDPAGAGTVAVSPNQPSYPNGTGVQLTATADAVNGFHFVNWGGDATGSGNPLNIVMNGNRTIVAHFAPNTAVGRVVISQVYGGGGNGAAPYKNDYVELYNRGSLAVDITGWSLQYASSGGSSWATTNLIGTIPPGRYYLVQQQAGVGTGAALPAADAIGVINLSSSTGKLALVNSGVVLVGNCPSGSNVIDFVGYGAADCSEGGSTAVAADNFTAEFRNADGCDDSGVNGADFAISAPAPRNSGTPAHICSEWLGVDDGLTSFALGNAVPNPARGNTRIPFALPRESDVRIEVLDVQGRLAATLVSGRLPAGRHDVQWDGAGAAGALRPGMYLVRMRVAGTTMVRRVTLTR